MRRTTSYRREVAIRPSLRSRAFNALLRFAQGKPLTHHTDVVALRRNYEKFDARRFKVDPKAVRTPVVCGGVPAEWVWVPESTAERTLLYLHGGSFAFRFPNAHAAFAARLCRRLRARALIPDYRLAPEFPFPAAPDDCQAVYRGLIAQGVDPRNMVLVGDSAGGTLALVTLYRTLTAREPLPACAVLLSPAVDCTLQSPSMVAFDGSDPVLRLADLVVLRHHYVPSPDDYTKPEVSPLFADFRGFPPLLFQAGASEMLRDDATRTAERAHEAGVDVELELWPDAAHVFQFASFLPESAQALNHIVRFVRMRTGWHDAL